MTLKKKLAVSSLAVSMAAASFAGFPFSSTGLAQHLGIVGTASAATASQAAALQKIKDVYAQLTSGSALYDYKIQAATIDQATFEEIFAPILTKLTTNEVLDSTDVAASYDVFQTVSSVVYDVYAEGFDGVGEVLYTDTNVALLNKIAAAAGVEDLTFDDFAEFVFGANGIEAELRTLLNGVTIDQLLNNEALVKQAINAVLAHRTGSATVLTVSDVVYNLGITTDDIQTSLINFKNTLPTVKPAVLSLAAAYLRANPFPTNPGTGSGGGGGTVTAPGTVTADGIYNVSALVSVVGDKATLNLVDADVIKAFDALIAANPGKTGLTLTLDLGTVNASIVEVPLSKAIIEAANAKGIANIAITFNGLTVTIPVAQFSDAVTLTVTTEPDSTVTSVTSLKLASKVYSFDLTVGGVATTIFKQPLTLKLPLVDVADLDKELLSVTKIVYNELQFEGGVLDGDFIVEPRDTFSSYAVLENKVNFSDVASVQAWAGRQIQVVAAKGAIEGIGAGKFAPKSNVTRAEFSKMLIRALNLENSTATESFSDVASTAWYAPYVAVAAEKGIVNGRSASQFDPNATITRAEMATMIARAVKVVNPDAAAGDASSLTKFSDAAKIAASLKDGVAFAASHNLVIGNAGKFAPNDTATRAEAAVIIYRTINFK
ncbi:S-layer homology domain-containing protein [Paenibacillus sp. S150]|uniref:S-layer homology domain-containing protein n=1 Tax=Paenibacillus sp. S150 TaxID=2749826 RepID=UPI001C5767B5|nr:S-layer homology domain-containing protein [Paenibacillus sp. S150]MBW4084519.1 S-layer homology domain-containing protein [Paenibacillus sp. S150]